MTQKMSDSISGCSVRCSKPKTQWRNVEELSLLVDKPLKISCLSLNLPLLCLRLPLDKSWEKLNFKFNHFLCKCLPFWDWNTMTPTLFCLLVALQLFPSSWWRYLNLECTVAYFNQHLLDICFIPEPWYVYETNKDECIKTFSSSFKELVVW